MCFATIQPTGFSPGAFVTGKMLRCVVTVAPTDFRTDYMERTHAIHAIARMICRML